jgi:tyrosyl-tRNA synthetase
LDEIYNILEIKQSFSKKEKWEKFLQYVWPIKNGSYTILNNSDWLEKISFVDFINEVGRNISINYLLAKETIKQRLEVGLSYLAFNYSLLQAYDFYYLNKKYNCNGQIGGSDQWGNLTTGLKLIRSFEPEENKTFAITFNLLTDKEGKKYSKSNSDKNILWMNSDKKNFFNFFNNMSDEKIEIFLEQFTFINKEQINLLKKINNPPKLRILQRILLELMWFLKYKNNESLYALKR